MKNSIECKKSLLMNDGFEAFTEGKTYEVVQRNSGSYTLRNNNQWQHELDYSQLQKHFIFQLVYICGPITNMPDFNRPLFAKVEQALIDNNFGPINPHNLCTHHVKELQGEELWQACMKTVIAELVKCDVLLLLPDWQNSRGAKIERNLANDLGIPVKHLSDFDIKIDEL